MNSGSRSQATAESGETRSLEGAEESSFWSGLRGRLVLVGLIVVAPLAGLLIYQSLDARQQVLAQARTTVGSLARLAAEELATRIEAGRHLLRAMAANPALSSGDPATCRSALAQQLREVGHYASFAVVAREGIPVCHSDPAVGGTSHVDRDYFQLAVATGTFSVGKPMLGPLSGRPLLALAWPIRSPEGEVTRVLVASLDLAWFGALVSKPQAALGTVLSIWDEEGRILYRFPEGRERIGRLDPSAPIAKAVRAARADGTIDVAGLDGVERVYALEYFDTLSTLGLTISVGADKAALTRVANRNLALSLTILAAGSALALAAALSLGDRLVRRPVATIMQAAGELAGGNLASRVPAEGFRGELAELAGSFNRMAARLQETVASRAELEREIAERRRVERELADLYDNAPCGYHSVDAEGNIVRINDTWLSWLGYSREEVVGKMRHPDLMTPASARRFWEEYFPQFKRQGWLKEIEFEYVRKNGTTFPASLSATTIRDGAGNYLLSRSVVTDITERKRVEDEVRALNARLDAANKELESFSYSVSHDLRAPLRAVDGYALMLEEDYAQRLDEEGMRLLGVVRSEAARMGRLIDDLLAFSRTGSQHMERVPVDMEALAREAAAEAARQYRPAEVRIGELPGVRGDLGLLRQVWVNLVGNAFKYSSKTSAPQIEIGGRANGTENEYWVRDNGAGFDPRYADKLFGVFRRLHREDEFPGTGVGLAIVQRVVTRHGGRVWAEGKLNEGARFGFALSKGA